MEKTQRLLRQLDIIPMEALDIPITVIGAGAIGSHTVKALAQMGFENITVFDDDIISEENLNSQGYPVAALGGFKVEVLSDVVTEYTNEEVDFYITRYTEADEPRPGIVIAAVDNMATRKLIWEKHKNNGETIAVIDPRMGAEMALLYTMRPPVQKDHLSYEKTLHSDEEARMEPCTAKATIYTALILSGLVCKAVKDLVTGKPYPRVVQYNIAENDCAIHKSE